MNLKDRQNTEEYKQPAEPEKKENKIQNSNDTTEKYRKLSQEQSKVIQTLQEQISGLTKNGREEDQKKIRKLSSQISGMKNELQSRSETIISLNETIAKLSESDKVLKENERLKKLNSELQESEQNARKEAEEEVAAVKNDYENRAHDMAIREEDISNREKRVTVRENNIREEIAIKAEQMIRDRKKSLENEQQNRMVKLESSYRSQTKELQDNYQRMKFVYRSIFYITLFYGMLTTFLMIIRTETIREDFMLFLNMIEKAAKSAYGWSVTAGTFAARLGDMISQPVIATIVHWILLILVVVVIIGGLGVLLALCGKRYIDFFREKQADEISVFVVLTIVALEVFLADAIKSILSINLIWLAMIIFAVYTVIRGVLQVENEKVTKGIIKWTMITAGSLAGIIVMVHFFGGLALVAIPIGIAICANGN